MSLAFEKHAPEMQRLWDTMKIIRDAKQLDAMAKKVLPHKAVYQAVERDTGVPWQMVAVIHIREAGLDDVGVFAGGIHNGQSWRRKATIVPKIGPFPSWHACALAAIDRHKFREIKNWTPGMMCAALEPFNGPGYRNRGLRTPYVWASTNHQQRGKFVRDHVFDPTVMDSQMGAAAMLRYLGVGQKVSTTTKVITSVGAGGTAAVAASPQSWWPWIIGGAVVLVAGYFVISYFVNRKKDNVQENMDGSEGSLPVDTREG